MVEINKGKLLLKKNVSPLVMMLLITLLLYKFDIFRGNATLPYIFYISIPLAYVLIKLFTNRNFKVNKDEESISVTVIPRLKFIRSLPYNKCDDVLIKQDIIDKLLGIYSLIIKSTSDKTYVSLMQEVFFGRFRWMWDFFGNESETVIEGLSKKEADSLKDFIENKRKSTSSSKEIQSTFRKNMYMGSKVAGDEILELLFFILAPFMILFLSAYVSSLF